MANFVTEIDWNSRALDILYTDVALEVLPELAAETADLARAIAPVRTRRTAVPPWAKRGYVGMPGRLKASVQWSLGEDTDGMYADIAALWYGRFLDPPAKQLHGLKPFLPSALLMTVEGRDFYLGL